jgi:pimeloyl-ACP methyl ester carboxylesterase
MSKLIPALGLVVIGLSTLFGCAAAPMPSQADAAPDGGRQEPAPRTFQQKLDHLDPQDQRVFTQRYLVDSTYAEGENAPVVFFIGGEGSLFEDPSAPVFLAGMRSRARRYHAHLVALEHRYYGASTPVAEQTAESMKYLDTAQALGDLTSFVQAMQATDELKGPWIAISGSYPGSLAAYFRAMHPELIVGALASSAPVRAKVDFSEYDEYAAQAFGTECAGNIRRIVDAFDAAVASDPAALAKMKAALGVDATTDNLDMAHRLDLSDFAQNGHFDGLCAAVESPDVLQALASLSAFRASQARAAAAAFPGDNPFAAADERSWWWQQCTEYGYIGRASDDRGSSIVSRLMTIDALHGVFCRDTFGIQGIDQADATNAKYYSRLFSPDTTRIIFTNGSNDPWSTLSITKDTPEALERDVHAIVIQGTSHTWDLFEPKADDLPALKAAREATDDIILRWLDDARAH